MLNGATDIAIGYCSQCAFFQPPGAAGQLTELCCPSAYFCLEGLTVGSKVQVVAGTAARSRPGEVALVVGQPYLTKRKLWPRPSRSDVHWWSNMENGRGVGKYEE